LATILVVDDEAPIRELCRLVLAGEGFRVLEAEDAAAGLNAAGAETPDLILLDIMMPQFDGLDVLRMLKSAEATRAIPVVMLTALDSLSNIAVATLAGAEGYLPKPFEPSDLVSLAQRFAGAHDRS
jgi:DNA-binding response OmpR family regulator